MKKNLFITLSLFSIFLAGCISSNNQTTEINPQEGEQLLNNQIEDFQYIKDLDNFLSYNILSITEDKPFTSDLYISAKFDENSSIQGGIDFSQNKISKSHNLESSKIGLNIETNKIEDNSTPFDLSGNVSLLYKDNEMYAYLHDLNIFMGEGNMVAKMYTLLGDLIVDNWVDLEVNSGGILVINEEENKKLPYIIGTLKNVLKTEDIKSSPNFIGSVSEIIDIINSYINLGISTNELKLIDYSTSYYKLSNNNIQKDFTGSFQGKDSTFDLYFSVYKKGLNIHLYNIKEYDEDIQDYKDTDSEFIFSLQEKSNSEYSIIFQSIKSQQNTINLNGKIKYNDTVEFSANFDLEPLEIIDGQKISGNIKGNITKKLGESDNDFPELTGNIITLTEILSSL